MAAVGFLGQGLPGSNGASYKGGRKQHPKASRGVPGARAELAGTESPAVFQAKVQLHVVREGETLSKVATRFGVSVDAIKRANGKAEDEILTGELLFLPGARKKLPYKYKYSCASWQGTAKATGRSKAVPISPKMRVMARRLVLTEGSCAIPRGKIQKATPREQAASSAASWLPYIRKAVRDGEFQGNKFSEEGLKSAGEGSRVELGTPVASPVSKSLSETSAGTTLMAKTASVRAEKTKALMTTMAVVPAEKTKALFAYVQASSSFGPLYRSAHTGLGNPSLLALGHGTMVLGLGLALAASFFSALKARLKAADKELLVGPWAASKMITADQLRGVAPGRVLRLGVGSKHSFNEAAFQAVQRVFRMYVRHLGEGGSSTLASKNSAFSRLGMPSAEEVLLHRSVSCRDLVQGLGRTDADARGTGRSHAGNRFGNHSVTLAGSHAGSLVVRATLCAEGGHVCLSPLDVPPVHPVTKLSLDERSDDSSLSTSIRIAALCESLVSDEAACFTSSRVSALEVVEQKVVDELAEEAWTKPSMAVGQQVGLGIEEQDESFCQESLPGGQLVDSPQCMMQQLEAATLVQDATVPDSKELERELVTSFDDVSGPALFIDWDVGTAKQANKRVAGVEQNQLDTT